MKLSKTFLFHNRFPSQLEFLLIAFFYACLMAILFQKVIVHNIPSLHAVDGLIPEDAIYFHKTAVKISESIHEVGWSEWRLYPAVGAAGNVSLLAAIYVLFGVNPLFFIPVTAFLHASSSTIIYKIGTNLSGGRIGLIGSLVGAVAFLIFPSSLLWYGQNLKDPFSILGILLIIDSWLTLQKYSEISLKKYVFIVIESILGIISIAIVRPYLPIILVVSLVLSFVVVIIPAYYFSRIKRPVLIGYQCCFIIMMLLISIYIISFGPGSVVFGIKNEQFSIVSRPEQSVNAFIPSQGLWRWQASDHLPLSIDNSLKRVSEIRAYFIGYGRSVSAGSDIDTDRSPNNALGAILYIPRALQIGLFSPFPNMWKEKLTPSRILVSIETCIWYLMFSGLVFLLYYNMNVSIFSLLIICSSLIAIDSYCTPNIGTLYRVRYASWQILLMLGAIGWVSFFRLNLFSVLYKHKYQLIKSDLENAIISPIRHLERSIGSGISVFGVTIIGYFLFFVRDLLLLDKVGVGKNLDSFFMAIMIPTFLISAFAIQITDVIMPKLVVLTFSINYKKLNLLSGKYLAYAIVILFPMGLILELCSSEIMTYILPNNSSLDRENSIIVLRLFSLILLISPWTVVGNAVLNVLNKSKEAALGQLIVPTLTIITQLISGDNFTVLATAFGMAFGTIINALWIIYVLYNYQIYLSPNFRNFDINDSFFCKYFNLLFPNLFTTAALPLSYLFSSQIGTGAISIWAIISKLIFVITGSVGAVSSSVLIPYIASALSSDNRIKIYSSNFFFIVIGSVIGGGVALFANEFVEPIMNLLTQSDNNISNINLFSVICYTGFMQLPASVSLITLTKVSIAGNQTQYLLIPSTIGFLSNFLICLFFVPEFGMIGVAAGALVSSTLSALILLIFTYKKIGLTQRQFYAVLSILSLWFVALFLEIYGNYITMLFALILIVILIKRNMNYPNSISS